MTTTPIKGTRGHLEIRTKLTAVVRLNCSRYGNPRFKLLTDDGVFTTQSDAACSYDVDNIARRIRHVTWSREHGSTGLPIVMHATPTGRVYDINVI